MSGTNADLAWIGELQPVDPATVADPAARVHAEMLNEAIRRARRALDRDPVERMARALNEEASRQTGYEPGDDWQELRGCDRDGYRKMARAARASVQDLG